MEAFVKGIPQPDSKRQEILTVSEDSDPQLIMQHKQTELDHLVNNRDTLDANGYSSPMLAISSKAPPISFKNPTRDSIGATSSDTPGMHPNAASILDSPSDSIIGDPSTANDPMNISALSDSISVQEVLTPAVSQAENLLSDETNNVLSPPKHLTQPEDILFVNPSPVTNPSLAPPQPANLAFGNLPSPQEPPALASPELTNLQSSQDNNHKKDEMTSTSNLSFDLHTLNRDYRHNKIVKIPPESSSKICELTSLPKPPNKPLSTSLLTLPLPTEESPLRTILSGGPLTVCSWSEFLLPLPESLTPLFESNSHVSDKLRELLTTAAQMGLKLVDFNGDAVMSEDKSSEMNESTAEMKKQDVISLDSSNIPAKCKQIPSVQVAGPKTEQSNLGEFKERDFADLGGDNEDSATDVIEKKRRINRKKQDNEHEYERCIRLAQDKDTATQAREEISAFLTSGEKFSRDIKYLLCTVNFFIPECASLCPKLSLEILTTTHGNIRCLQHANTHNRKQNNWSGTLRPWNVTGVPYQLKKAGEQLEEGTLHCGCHWERAVLEFFLFKTGKIESRTHKDEPGWSREGWHMQYLHPRLCELVLGQVQELTTWCLDDIWTKKKNAEGFYVDQPESIQLQSMIDRLTAHLVVVKENEDRQAAADKDVEDLVVEKSCTFPLTFENVQKDPSILTRFAEPGIEAGCRPFNGKVGNISQGDVLTFSPNANYLLTPPQLCRPFTLESGHLALMLCPSNNLKDDFYPAWLNPHHDQFCVLNASLRLGKLETGFCAPLVALCFQVLKEVPPDVNDPCLSSLETNLQRLMHCLELPASKEKIFLLVSQVQHLLIELNARSRWVGDEWQKRLKEAAGHIHQPLVDTVGVFTESLNDLDFLFYAGIPVWYVCLAKSMPYAHIDSRSSLLREDTSQQFVWPNGFVVDCTDSSPRHKTVYEGLSNKPNCFQKMAAYVDSLLNDPVMLFSAQPFSMLLVKHPRSSKGHPDNLNGEMSRFSPYKKNKPKVSIMSNTFLIPTSIFMPTPLTNWESALHSLSEHNQALRSPSGVNSRFRVPPVWNIISPAKSETVRLLFHGWLQQAMAMSSGGLWLEIQRCGSFDRDSEDFSVRPVFWGGSSLSAATDFLTDIGREIIWELQELGFQNNLITLDKHVDESKMRPAERRALLNGCWEGMASYVDICMASKGLGAPLMKGHWPYLRALHRVMRTWKGEQPELLMLDLPTDEEGSADFDAFLRCLEYALAHFYTTSFLNMFGRAASIPFQL
ncbi:hypothetical protein GYMLUDRAFT_251498 [Collybiopsis luxurians FD-317 M1]|uniref:Uncharacterized protein n=1 Tax=Collybiopsis luxurians FD-317 M1 TaxID=944289 RepID=A0A0D0BR86_9AGAR|nr:hypothetical protein GYMLUDRAFT_251498 [Collybiopsis luxurians FD-317 M1]